MKKCNNTEFFLRGKIQIYKEKKAWDNSLVYKTSKCYSDLIFCEGL